ncbi:MAG: DNA-3-methyladenine glycosylase I [Candidatus Eremiobacteraeota bacterium]|nr:DNA-3-methyladenine glycosylase I [Candidatus Eremiobacteraeota bacterium]
MRVRDQMNDERGESGGQGDGANRRRCAWAKTPALILYHDQEWGVPLHDDSSLFELLVLEGAQAGLSWETILRKRSRYRELFGGFDPIAIARITPARVQRLMRDPGIVRNRAKIESAVGNARALLRVREEFGTFDAYVWRFVRGAPIVNRRKNSSEIPAATKESQTLSSDLVKRGFRFAGPTICYAFMQAAGLVNDHVLACAWHDSPGRAF